jgi:Abortive infection C-terminus
MATFTPVEKRILEEYLQMGGGYVLDFSNRRFQEFVFDSVRLNIDDEAVGGFGSKAVRLRYFWRRQPNHIVGKLIRELVDYRRGTYREPREDLAQKCHVIAESLLQSAAVKDADVLLVLGLERQDFDRLTTGVLDCINRNDPEAGLDRLHTFTIAFVRALCEKHRIPFDRKEPLHTIFGKYLKKLKELNRIETSMTERILKSSISVLDAFNDVRNNWSLAHDNDLLNRHESLLILNNVTSLICFLWRLEKSDLFGEVFNPEEDEILRELDI